MIACTRRRELTLRAGHLSAASGLVRRDSRLFVIADDELALGMFDAQSDAPGELLMLFPGTLPDAPEARKRAKPDLEALTLLPGGALLAIPSGSAPNRVLGAVVHERVRTVDFADLFDALRSYFPALNIEGAVALGDELLLFQRGAPNACARFALAPVLDGIAAGRLGALAPRRIDTFELGAIGSVPLTFTDACALPDGRVLFCAAAEDTDNPYDDGFFGGAALGAIDAGRLAWIEPLECAAKVEGIDAIVRDGAIHALLVTDADDPNRAALLLSAAIER